MIPNSFLILTHLPPSIHPIILRGKICKPMGQTLYIEYDKQTVDQSLITKHPEAALRLLIAQQTAGHSGAQMLHTIVRTVMPKNDNALKRLVYYYFETLGDDRGLMVCMNQISKDLSSPNEYVRGLVLRFISRLNNYDYVSLLLAGVRDNISNKTLYVRMNAVQCLIEVACKFDIDIEDEIHSILSKESNPEVLCIVFRSLERLGMPAEEYIKDDYFEDVLVVLVNQIDDQKFLVKCLSNKSKKVVYSASIKLLSLNDLNDDETKNTCIENIISSLKANSSLKYDIIPFISRIKTHSLELLTLLDPYEYEFSKKIIERAFENAETHEFIKIVDILQNEYVETKPTSDKKKQYRILLLESMGTFTLNHCIYRKDMISICMKNILSDNPELIYASLKFLESVSKTSASEAVEKDSEDIEINNESDDSIHRNRKSINYYDNNITLFLINNFANIKHGKILRLVFEIISEGINRRYFETLLDTILDCFTENKLTFLLNSEIFNGTHLCLCLVSVYNPVWNLKAKTLGVLIRFFNIEKYRSNEKEDSVFNMDSSSKSTISLCIRSILKDVAIKRSDSSSCISYNKIDVLKPLSFSLLDKAPVFPSFEWENPMDYKSHTVQLSGLGDPLYIEANVVYNKHEITLDILVINQTDYYLQNLNLDFIASKYILMSSNAIDNISLQPNAATTLKCSFSIRESCNCFISASVSFRFPKNHEYASVFVQNLGDINFDISEFLEGANINFREHWRELEWENVYVITFNRDNGCGGGLFTNVLDKISNAINGVICDKQSFYNFLVANIASFTNQRSLVLINVCISQGENTVAEIRIRSKDDEIVKSICELLSNCLKE